MQEPPVPNHDHINTVARNTRVAVAAYLDAGGPAERVQVQRNDGHIHLTLTDGPLFDAILESVEQGWKMRRG